MDYFVHLLSIIKDLSILGYFIIGGLAFFESVAFIGLVIPGSVAVIVGGFLAAQGIIDLGDLFIFAAAGAILGDSFSFYLGKKGIIVFNESNKIFKKSLLEKGEIYFKKYGNKSVFWGRFIGWVRPIVPFIAGLFNLDGKTFLFWNVSSGLLWAVSHIALGYFFGQAWGTIVLWSTRGSMFIAIFIGFVFVLYIARWLAVKKGKYILFFLVSIWNSIKQAIVNNSDVQKLVKKHRLFFEFIKGRLDKSKFSGLPITLLLMAFIYTVSLYIGIMEDIIRADVMVAVDTRVANLLAVFRNIEITKFFLGVTLLGKWQIVSGFTAAAVGILWVRRKRLYIMPLLLVIAGSEFFTELSKMVFRRPRPELAVYTERSFSFPSGHAAMAAAFYGFLIYVLIRNVRRWKTKVNLLLGGITVVLMIGFSRLYLGVHYVSDVWGGYLVGILWLIISISISEWICSKKKSHVLFPLPIKTRVISAIMMVAAVSFYVMSVVNYHPQISLSLFSQEEMVIQDVNDIFSDNQLKYTETLLGEEQEPVSFVILAENDEKLVSLFTDSGWFLADKVSVFSVTKLAKTVFLRQAYSQAPMTPSFWNEKTHDLGFEKPTESNNVWERHHARFWKTNYVTEDEKRVYVGTASLDINIKWGITHKIGPDIDMEREFLFSDIKKANDLMGYRRQKLVEPSLGQNFSGDLFFTDGRAYIILMN